MQNSQASQLPSAVRGRALSKEVGHRLSELINSPVLNRKKINDLALDTKTPIKYLTKSNKHSFLGSSDLGVHGPKSQRDIQGRKYLEGFHVTPTLRGPGGVPGWGRVTPGEKDCLSILSGRATFPSPTHNITQRSSYKARLEPSSSQVAGKVLWSREFR
jgi:hypothetical protein